MLVNGFPRFPSSLMVGLRCSSARSFAPHLLNRSIVTSPTRFNPLTSIPKTTLSQSFQDISSSCLILRTSSPIMIPYFSYSHSPINSIATPLTRRSFSSSSYSSYAFGNYRPRRSNRSNQSSSFSLFNNLPAPLQSILPIVGVAGLLFFVAAPLLLIVLPPVFLGAYIYMRNLKAKRKDLFEKRWSDMASYHMVYQSDRAALNEQETLKKLVMRRVSQAIQDNEHEIATKLGFKVSSAEKNGKFSFLSDDSQNLFDRSHLALSDIHSIEEDWRVSAQGIAQSMTVYSLGLVDKNRDYLPIADVNIVVRTRNPKSGSDIDPSRTGSFSRTRDVRIELVSTVGVKKQFFVLDSPSENIDNSNDSSDSSSSRYSHKHNVDSNTVIDVKARNVR